MLVTMRIATDIAAIDTRVQIRMEREKYLFSSAILTIEKSAVKTSKSPIKSGFS